MKILIFDASSLISLSMNGLLEELRSLKENFDGKFIIPEEVKFETVDRPLKIHRFELEALRIKKLLEDKVLELPSALKISDRKITERKKYLLELANEMFTSRGKSVHMIDEGETACLALSKILNEQKIENVLVIDERTTRLLVEKPENLKDLLERKLHTKVKLSNKHFKNFKGMKVVRSIELIYVAHKKGLTKVQGPQSLEAMLYALKFKGAAISHDEIKQLLKMK